MFFPNFTLNDINDCPDTGCANVDPHLNRQKNTRSLDSGVEQMTIQQMRNLPDPVPGFRVGNTRERIQALGEGKKIVVVANAIAVRKGSKESCNCGANNSSEHRQPYRAGGSRAVQKKAREHKFTTFMEVWIHG